MVLAVPQHPVARAYVLQLAQAEFDHMLNLLVWIFDDTVIRKAPQPGGQTLYRLPALHFTQAPRVATLTHQIQVGLGHRAF